MCPQDDNRETQTLLFLQVKPHQSEKNQQISRRFAYVNPKYFGEKP